MPTITVAPVVVKAETASNMESVKERCGPNTKGRALSAPSTTQNRVTTRKPSRVRRSTCSS